jgi:hypothetical protein
MKKPRLEAFDPKHTDKMAQSFASLPTIQRPESRPAPAPAKPNHEERSVAPARRRHLLPFSRLRLRRISPGKIPFGLPTLSISAWIKYGISPLSKSRLYRVGLKRLIEDYEQNGEESLRIRSLREEKD